MHVLTIKSPIFINHYRNALFSTNCFQHYNTFPLLDDILFLAYEYFHAKAFDNNISQKILYYMFSNSLLNSIFLQVISWKLLHLSIKGKTDFKCYLHSMLKFTEWEISNKMRVKGTGFITNNKLNKANILPLTWLILMNKVSTLCLKALKLVEGLNAYEMKH
jgi:hypothetical protein